MTERELLKQITECTDILVDIKEDKMSVNRIISGLDDMKNCDNVKCLVGIKQWMELLEIQDFKENAKQKRENSKVWMNIEFILNLNLPKEYDKRKVIMYNVNAIKLDKYPSGESLSLDKENIIFLPCKE